MSKADMTQAVNTLSVCIQNRMTVQELAFVDFFFQPHYNKPWNLLNTAGLAAMKRLNETENAVPEPEHTKTEAIARAEAGTPEKYGVA